MIRSVLLALLAAGHPMHTSVAELESAGGEVRVAIRVYADDLAGADADAPADSALARYARTHFLLADAAGRPVSLLWLGVDRTGGALVLRMRAPLPGGLGGARVVSSLLHERFTDQVNIVRATEGGRTTTLLFLRGDGPRTLP